MPSLLTHHYFATLVIKKYKKDYPFLLDHYSVVTLGAQGPDPLFFYGHAPFSGRKNSKSINQFGSHLHADPTKLINLLSRFTKETSPLELSYLFGVLTHYVLDRTMHPYVFFHTGFDHHGDLVLPFQGAHAKFEVALDVAFQMHYQLDHHIFHPQVTLGVSDEALSKIDQMYQQAYPDHLVKNDFYDSVIDMKKTTSFLYNVGIFKHLFVFLVAGKKSLPFNLIHPKKLSLEMVSTLLNLDKKIYRHPVTRQSMNDSCLEMIEQALRLFTQFLTVLQHDYLKHEEFKNDLMMLIDKIDYDGKKVGSIMNNFVPFYQGFEK